MLSHDFSRAAMDTGVMVTADHLDEQSPDISLNADTAQERANIYRFLVTPFLQAVPQEFVDNICDRDVLDGLAGIFGEAAVTGLRGYAEQVDMDVNDLKQEYMDLFCVPTSRYVMPFEDVYFGMYEDDKGEQIRGPLLGERAVIAQQIYRAAGAEMLEARSELPNHIGIELAFMSFLVEKEILLRNELHAGSTADQENHSTLAAYQKIQQQFLKHHLMSWYPKLSSTIQANTHTQFYKGMAQFAGAFLKWDLRRLKSIAIPEFSGSTQENQSA